MTKCPCCGYDPDLRDTLFVSVLERAIVYNGQQVFVRRHVAELAKLMQQAHGRWITRDSIIENLWENDGPEWVEKCLDVALCQLRKALTKLGAGTIDNSYGSAVWRYMPK